MTYDLQRHTGMAKAPHRCWQTFFCVPRLENICAKLVKKDINNSVFYLEIDLHVTILGIEG